MTDDVDLADLLESAEAFAHEAGALTLRYFGALDEVDRKGDGTPVTVADRGAEELLRERIGARYPDHGILGEEFPEKEGAGRVRWILDPIDGTRSFVHGVPLYGVMIGIELDGEPVVGVLHFPPLDETVAAARGMGCRWNDAPCAVSSVDDLSEAVVLTTDERRIRGHAIAPGWERLGAHAAFVRNWGDCYGHALVATGRAEVMVDPILAPWDAGPLVTILTEAGGDFLTLDGRRTIHGGSGVSTNAALSEEVRALLIGA